MHGQRSLVLIVVIGITTFTIRLILVVIVVWATPVLLSINICLYMPSLIVVPSYLRINVADGWSILSITPVSPSINAGMAART